MSEQVNEQELVQFIAERTNVDINSIKMVLNHAQTYLNNAKEDANGEVEIDSDELVDYILSSPDVKLDEITIETILDLEMDYLMEKGLAGYVD
jgi:hypothetical protein